MKRVYCFYEMFLKNTRESKRQNRVDILSFKLPYRPMRARIVSDNL